MCRNSRLSLQGVDGFLLLRLFGWMDVVKIAKLFGGKFVPAIQLYVCNGMNGHTTRGHSIFRAGGGGVNDPEFTREGTNEGGGAASEENVRGAQKALEYAGVFFFFRRPFILGHWTLLLRMGL